LLRNTEILNRGRWRLTRHAAIGLTFLVLGACNLEDTLEAQSTAPLKDSLEAAATMSRIGAEISVTGGRVRGQVGNEADNALKHYHGIPYVAPPLGELRWARPAPVIPWEGILDATEPGPNCPQPLQGVGFYIMERPNQSEDCLTINVWTRADRPDEGRPVMFWIHGGGLSGAAGSEQTGELLSDKGAVLVTFNYRIGRLGFFAHPELSAGDPQGVSGNQGFRDQIAALRWVHDNIAQFGGDPNNITIFGESAGAGSVSALQASPLARGLFHRAIGQSGGIFNPTSHRNADKPYAPSGEAVGLMLGQALVGTNGDASLRALRALPVEKIIEVSQSNPLFSTYEMLPTVDGEVLPDEIANIFSRGEQADVPTLIGSNADEGTAVMGYLTSMVGEGVEGFTRFKQGLLPEASDEIDQLYPVNNSLGVMQSWRELFEDVTFLYPARRWARDMAKVESDVYLYLFTWHPPVEGHEVFKSFHGAGTGYVFGQLTMFGAVPTDADREFSEFIAETWVRFATTGDPNGGDLEGWRAFTPDNEIYHALGPETATGKDLRLKQMALIERAWAERRASATATP
jgi:para-nitrobenzyl esterase